MLISDVFFILFQKNIVEHILSEALIFTNEKCRIKGVITTSFVNKNLCNEDLAIFLEKVSVKRRSTVF